MRAGDKKPRRIRSQQLRDPAKHKSLLTKNNIQTKAATSKNARKNILAQFMNKTVDHSVVCNYSALNEQFCNDSAAIVQRLKTVKSNSPVLSVWPARQRSWLCRTAHEYAIVDTLLSRQDTRIYMYALCKNVRR